MTRTSSAPILLCGDHAPPGDDVRCALEQAGYRLHLHANGTPLEEPWLYGAIVIDAAHAAERARVLCHTLRGRLTDAFVPIVMVMDDAAPEARLATLESGADAYVLRPFAKQELLGQVEAFLRLKRRHDHLAEKSAEVNRVNKRLQAAYHQIDQELELARRIQESFLPQSFPEVPHVRFAVHYQPCGRVGGDFYDVFRLDERHIGLYIADAMGHGVPASLLTIFVKKSVRAKEITGQSYRLVPPGELMQRLNRDMIDQALSEHPFITMVYLLLDFHTGALTLARAGHPYPIYVPREGPPRLWQIEGSLLGVFDTQYAVQTVQLQPGDKVLLYTDGMDAASFADQPVGIASLLAAVQHHRALPIQDLVSRLAGELFRQTRLTDDLTLLGLEMT
jgi:phosphoserine phosphatase RsbU/P